MCARSLRRATSPVTPWPGTSIPAHVVRGDESPSLEGTGQSVSQPYSVTQSPLSLCVRHGPGVTDAAGPGAMWSPRLPRHRPQDLVKNGLLVLTFLSPLKH